MITQKMTYSDFVVYKNVSRETFCQLEIYIELLIKWQKAINLISASTLPYIWHRHIVDSAQLMNYIDDKSGALADIGSGAGFPGLVLAILGVKSVTLVESDKRKCAFLQEVARQTNADVTIVNQRVDEVSYTKFSTITARAFAAVPEMLNNLSLTLNTSHNILLLKGKSYKKELEEARKYWDFDTEVFPSATDKEGVILSITNPSKHGAA